MSTTVAAVVLAAGASSRMGSPKPLLPLGGRTYLQAVIATLRAAEVERIVVVLGAGSDGVIAAGGLDGCQVVGNPDWRRGMLTSLQTGIAALWSDPTCGGLLLCLVDQPRIAASTVAAVTAAWDEADADLVIPTYRGAAGHPVLLGRPLWTELEAAPPEQGPRVVVNAHRDHAVLVEVDDPWILRDADTPAEHARMAALDVDGSGEAT